MLENEEDLFKRICVNIADCLERMKSILLNKKDLKKLIKQQILCSQPKKVDFLNIECYYDVEFKEREEHGNEKIQF